MCTRVLVLLALQAGFAYCFTWDIVVGETKRLVFYNNGILTHTEEIPSAEEIFSLTYDPVHYRVLFADNHYGILNISSFDLATRNIQHLVTRKSNYYFTLAYDPVTQLLFCYEQYDGIYSISLNPASSIYKTVNAKLLVTLNSRIEDIAVDSCGGYIYWSTAGEIERARFDGSEREVLINSTVYRRTSLVIDQQTQKMYWIDVVQKSGDYQASIQSADFNGKNRITLYTVEKKLEASSLSVSKEFIYWNDNNNKIWKLPKNNPQQLDAKIICNTNRFVRYFYVIAANYTIKEQIKGNQNCDALKNLISNEPERDCMDVKLLCFHGTKVSEESRCECTQGYTGERCDISICQNYCLQGNCSVSAEGLPKCSCTAGYAGERCEINSCNGHCLNGGVCSLNEEYDPVCECKKEYEGERCTVSICKDYCFQGNCSVSAEGQPICRCTDGYSGRRCEINGCHKHCLNSGICSLNEENEPVCECTADYEGERCDVSTTHCGFHTENTSQRELRDLRRRVRQVIKEELKHAQQFFSDKIDEYEVNI